MSESKEQESTVKVVMSRSLLRAANRRVRLEHGDKSLAVLAERSPRDARMLLVYAFGGTLKGDFETPEAYDKDSKGRMAMVETQISLARLALPPETVVDRVEVVVPQRWDRIKQLMGGPAVEEVVTHLNWTANEYFQFAEVEEQPTDQDRP